MNKEQYRDKLRGFNRTLSYQKEMDFFISLINPQKGEKILDYGCGIGTMTEKMRERSDTVGYDAMNYFEDTPTWFINKLNGLYDKIYFMHSLAHIYALDIHRLPVRKGGRIYVFTPNLMWLSSKNSPDYTPDPTVYRHFNATGLAELFQGYKIVIQGSYGEVSSNYSERLFIIAEK